MENKIRRHFDEALKMRYKKDYIKHLNEPIPHSHGKGKIITELTDEIDAKG